MGVWRAGGAQSWYVCVGLRPRRAGMYGRRDVEGDGAMADIGCHALQPHLLYISNLAASDTFLC
eukprot:352275-Chlamydomonas_euryale.AAC.2